MLICSTILTDPLPHLCKVKSQIRCPVFGLTERLFVDLFYRIKQASLLIVWLPDWVGSRVIAGIFEGRA